MATIEELKRLISQPGGGVMSPNYMGQQEAAYQNLVGQLLANSNQENALRSAFEKQYGFMQEDQGTARRKLIDALANRGMLRSTPAVRQQNQISQDYMRGLDSLIGNRDAGLSNLATNKLNAESNYGSTIANLQQQMADAQSQATTQQLIAEATQRQQEQQTAFNNQQTQRETDWQQQMLNYYKGQSTPTPAPTQAAPPPPTLTTSYSPAAGTTQPKKKTTVYPNRAF